MYNAKHISKLEVLVLMVQEMVSKTKKKFEE
jgi:hypothetical protein